MPNSPQQSEVNTSAPKRRRAPKGEKRRAELLDAATQVFAKHGYAASSMRDIAAITGITTVGLLHHFPNKVALLMALLERRDRRVAERLSELDMEPTLEGWRKFVIMVMRLNIESRKECQAAMMINIESLLEEHPAHRWHEEKFELVYRHARAHFRMLIEVGEVRSELDVDAVVTEVFSVLDGLQIQWLRSPEDTNVMKILDNYLQRLVDSVKS